MKKIISTVSLLLLVGFMTVNAQCCNNPKPGCDRNGSCVKQGKETNDVKAYYFHGTRRCMTCQAVEDVTKEALKEYYGDKVSFSSVNSEKDSNNPMIEKYKVSGQTLLIVKGENVVNLTNFAFMNARTNPDKLKSKIKSTVDSMN